MKQLFNIIVVAAALLIVTPAVAQSSFSIQYSMGFGTGDTKSFISKSSFRGAAMEYRYLIQPNISVGADVGWNVFYERKASDTYTSGTVALSGVQYRYINAVPIFLAFDYHLKPGEKINPFVGLGVGTLFTRRNTDMNLYTIEDNVWAFGLRPEFGIRMQANDAMDIILVGKYNYGFSAKDLPAQSYFALNVGFVFKKT
jgi:outer membrane protein W